MMHDVAVVGAGLVGSAAALQLADLGLRVVLLDARQPTPPPEAWDTRMYAISPGSKRLLTSVGAWDLLPAERLQPVAAMQIWGERGATLHFSAYQAKVPELAVILENGALQWALWQRVQAHPNLSLCCPAKPVGWTVLDHAVQIELDHGAPLQARLIVGADGAHSWVRTNLGIAVHTDDYRQTGVVANFATTLPHGGCARQWFSPEGILAWLPLPGNRMSMVWSTPDDHARQLLALDPADLTQAVSEAGGGVLGEMTLLTPAAGFPLKRQRNASMIGRRALLVGDAAHTVHPLAGQGVNLGLQDVQALTEVLAERGLQDDVGDAMLLRRYQRHRSQDVWLMQQVTHGLKHLFNNDDPLLAWMRHTGLGMVDQLGSIKGQLVRHALG